MQRILGPKDKKFIEEKTFLHEVVSLLDNLQEVLYAKALQRLKTHVHTVTSKEDFYKFFQDPQKSGFIKGYWSEEEWIEEQIKKDLNVTIRCIPLEQLGLEGLCVISGKKTHKQVIYAKAY